MELALILGAIAVVGSVVVLWWTLSGPRETPTVLHVSGPPQQTATTDLRSARMQLGVGERAIDPLVRSLSRFAKRYTPRGRIAAVEQRLLQAGTPPGWTVERVLAAKTGGAALGGVLGVLWFFSRPGGTAVVVLALLAVAGWFLPDLVLRGRADERQAGIRRSLSDTVDQIVIMVEAGLGLDAALARVSITDTGPLADELARVAQDTRVGMPRADALRAMANRVPVPELRQFVTAVTQAEKLGVSVVQALRVQSGDLRLKRSQYAEESAAKLPVKLIFPTMFCVFPSLFVVLLAPAVADIFAVF